MAGLSEQTCDVVRRLFRPEDYSHVAALLEEECGNNLPFLEKLDEYGLERVRYAALKVSDGDLEKLRRAVALAKTDWRDLLVAAGFANSLEAHKYWACK